VLSYFPPTNHGVNDMIARAADGLPLAASLQEDEQSGRSLLEYQNQAKGLFKKLTVHSPAKVSIETGPYIFHYVIDNDACFLVLCERGFSKKSAFTFLEEMAAEFTAQYGRRVAQVARPYSFIEFDTYIQIAKAVQRSKRKKTRASATRRLE